MMKNWIGWWLIGVSVVHTLFALVVFHEVLLSLVRSGLFDSVGNDAMRGAVAWFLLFGIATFLAGQAMVVIEQRLGVIPRSLGFSLLVMVALGLCLMPVSGFWLAIPPVVGILRGKPARA
ncbi:MAG: DUF6463 family protein [Bryobacterales bacterium]|jgi:hypothetical protein|nr:DUF6463 family protein [Bryobacterales bacterium]